MLASGIGTLTHIGLLSCRIRLLLNHIYLRGRVHGLTLFSKTEVLDLQIWCFLNFFNGIEEFQAFI